MRLPHDIIMDAYFNQAGTEFGEKVRKRINWICQEAIGERILDVGCSQGITSILLGREGKQVLGIDYLTEAVDYAKSQLSNEPEDVQRLVKFEQGNFITMEFKEELFDVILFTEVLEHLNQPEQFLVKGLNLLRDNGIVVITVPFGINDFFDHKKTYYLMDLLELVDPFLNVKKVEFMGKWIGLVGTKKRENLEKKLEDVNYSTNYMLTKYLEQNFYEIERELINKIKEYQYQINELKLENSELLKSIELMQKSVEEQIENKSEKTSFYLEENLNSLMKEISNLASIKSELTEHMNELVNDCRKKDEVIKLSIVDEKEQKLQVKKELLESQKKIEKLLVQNKDLAFKFNILKNSKLGRLTLKYWKFRGRLNNNW